MATMTSLIGLINKIQRACTVLGDHGGEGLSLWEALPSVAVVGGQVPSLPVLSFFCYKILNNLGLHYNVLRMDVLILCLSVVKIRVRGNRQCWKVWWEEIFFLVDLVMLSFYLSILMFLSDIYLYLQQCS